MELVSGKRPKTILEVQYVLFWKNMVGMANTSETSKKAVGIHFELFTYPCSKKCNNKLTRKVLIIYFDIHTMLLTCGSHDNAVTNIIKDITITVLRYFCASRLMLLGEKWFEEYMKSIGGGP